MNVPPSSTRLAALCHGAASIIQFEIVDETGSTNADLLARVSQLGSHAGLSAQPVLRWALHQTAGKGRAGRSWLVADDGALTFSLAWRLRIPLQRLGGLSLAVGVMLAEQLAILGVDVQLKWPNDVLRSGAKLAGVLIETAIDRQDAQAVWVVIGIGMNLSHAKQLSAELGREVADVGQAVIDREAWMAALAQGLAEGLMLFEEHGFAAFAARWNALDAYAGQRIHIVDNGIVRHEGRCAGVEADGSLRIDTKQGIVHCASGDVSLREVAA